MRNRFGFIIICIITFLFLTACTSNETDSDTGGEGDSAEDTGMEQSDNSQNEDEVEAAQPEETAKEETKQQTEDLPPVPFTLEESVNYPHVGQFAGEEFSDQKEITEVLDQFPKLTEGSNTEEIEYGKKYLWSLFKENMTMVNVPIDQWESMTFSDPTGESQEAQAKENYNVALLLDASGSMGNYENDRTRMDLAKEAIQQFVESLPEAANVSLYVYGHVGSGSDADKAKSCKAIDEVYPLSNYNAPEFSNALNQFEPAGWTPMAGAIKQVQGDYGKLNAEQNSNVIYIVSDGVETCDGDPVEAIGSLADSDIDPVVNIIGYQVDNEGLVQLKEMAESSEGRYVNAASQEDIMAEFQQTADMAGLWADWHNDAQRNISDLFNTISSQLADWSNGERGKLGREHGNLTEAVQYLKEQEIIDSDAYYEILGDVNDAYYGVGGEITDVYYEINGMNIDELYENRGKITDRYYNR